MRRARGLFAEGRFWTLASMRRKLLKVAQLPFYLAPQYALLRTLRHEAYRPLLRSYPRTLLKCYADHYLIRGLSGPQCFACQKLHYQALLEYLPHKAIAELPEREIELARIPHEQMRCVITLGLFNDILEFEGELCLRLRAEDQELFSLSFTVAPEQVFGLGERRAFLVSRLQGSPTALPLIRQLTSDLYQNSLSSLLFSSLLGLAEAWRISSVVGVSAARQRSNQFGDDKMLANAYDAFFTDLGLERSAEGLFLGSIPLPQKPLAQIKSGHKIRTRKKRAFRQSIALAARESALRLQNESIPAGALAWAPRSVEDGMGDVSL